jgi:four helix bundle protein
MDSLVEDGFRRWQVEVPEVVRNDAIWSSVGYRLSLYSSDFVSEDVQRLKRRDRHSASQLHRASRSISVNFAEGYSRSGVRDRIRFYEYSLGSARECREWWFKLRSLMPAERFHAGLELFTRVIRVLLAIIAAERRKLQGECSVQR